MATSKMPRSRAEGFIPPENTEKSRVGNMDNFEFGEAEIIEISLSDVSTIYIREPSVDDLIYIEELYQEKITQIELIARILCHLYFSEDGKKLSLKHVRKNLNVKEFKKIRKVLDALLSDREEEEESTEDKGDSGEEE
jgi:hypothetical protein